MITLEDVIKKATGEREQREVKSWQASKLGSCLTGVYLERLRAKPDTEFDDRTLRVFSAGKIFENWLIEEIKKSESVKTETQLRVEWPEQDLTGYADLMVENDNKILYEIKSKHSKAFWYMEKEGKPNRHNEMQLWSYLKALNIEEGRLIYVSKDDLAFAEFQVFLNDTSLESEVIGELTTLNRAWKEKLPPPVTFSKDDWRGKYCRWHKQCISQPKYLS